MKFALPFLIAIIVSISTMAANDHIESTIERVTVYKEGAIVFRTAEALLNTGLSQLKFVGLPHDLSEETISIVASDGVAILSLHSELEYSGINYQDPIQVGIRNQIRDLQDSIALIESHGQAFQSEQALIKNNYKFSESDKFSVDELKKLAAFHNTRLIEIENALHVYKIRLREMNSRLLRLNNDVRRNKEEASGQSYTITLDIESTISGTETFTIQYYVSEAGWTPSYDLKLHSIQDPLEFIYKADIYQNTAEDWKGVKVTVSSASPSFGQNQPILEPYFLYFNNWISQSPKKTAQPLKNNLLRGRVTDRSGEALIGANIIVKGTSIGTITDIEGIFQINVPHKESSIVVSFTGYDTYETPITSGYMEVQLSEGAMLEEVVVTGLSVRGYSSVERHETKDQLRGRISGVSLNSYAQGVNKFNPRIEYIIDSPTTILSEEEVKTIKLQSVHKTADLSYLAIPKYDEAAYLIASIEDWYDLNLQSGDYNVIFEGKYLTSYYLDVDAVEKELKISLGVDENIRVRRAPVREFTKKKFLSKDIQEEKTWKIEITNGKTDPITLKLVDQYPISKNGDIKVDLKSNEEGTIDEKTGEITWMLNIPASKTISKTIRYEVKHPKDQVLIID